MRSYDQFVNRPHEDVRQQLLELGMSESAISMSLPQVWFPPATTDPYSPAVIMIVEAIQHRMGLPQTGYIDAATKRALSLKIGQGWANRPWVVVVGQVLANRKAGGAETMYSMGADEMTFPAEEASFTVKGGVCIPTTSKIRRRYKELQRQINRAQSAVGVGPQVKVDGAIGSDTLGGARRVAAKAPLEVGGLRFATSCSRLAQTAEGWIPLLKKVGDRAGGGGGGGALPELPGNLPKSLAGIPIPIVAAAAGIGLVYWYKRMR